jgi:TPR repeat protein
MTGNGAVQNPQLADELYGEFVKLAESMDDIGGSVYAALAQCYAKGMGTELDMEKAMDAAVKAIESGDLSVFEQTELGQLLRDRGQDMMDAIEAELGESGYSIADLSDETKTQYMQDAQAFIDRVKAAEAELEKSNQLYADAKAGVMELAEAGNIIALKLMGDYYFGALGGEAQDYEKAMDYYMQAADFDFAPAQAQIALMYQEGYGVDVDYAMAMEWNNRAAQQGNAQGQAQIGYLYHMGLGVTQNLDEAGRWYSRAADQGDTWAAAKLQQTEITNPQLAFEFHA